MTTLNEGASACKDDCESEQPAPNKTDILAHLYALFPTTFVHDYPDAKIEIAYGLPTGKPDKAEWFNAFELARVAEFAAAKNADGNNVYVGAALRRGDVAPFGRGNDDDFLAAAHCWIDLDKPGECAAAYATAKELQLDHSIAVTTGTKSCPRMHVYFALKDGVADGARLREANEALRSRLGGDPNVKNPGRIMRLAGTVSFPSPKKQERGYVPELVALKFRAPNQIQAHTIERLIALAPSQAANTKSSLGLNLGGRTDADLVALLEETRTPGEWHVSMRGAVASMIGRGWGDLEIRLACAPYCDSGANDPDLTTLIDTGRKKFDKPEQRHSTERPREVGILDVLCLANVTPKPIEWLWRDWVAIGKVSVLAGDGGQGKSTILCDLAARTTRGETWPDGAAATRPGGVIVLAAEDDIEDTLAPRLLAVGADMERVFNIRAVKVGDDERRRSFNLQADLAALEKEIEARGNIRLVIIDPISSYLGPVDSHKNAEVRSVLEPLGEMAARMRVAVICNNHFSKGGGNANSRIIGSVAFVNQARAAFIVTPDAEIEGRLLLMPSKMNNAPIKHGLAYRIESCMVPGGGIAEILTSRIMWESSPVEITADEALAAHADSNETKTGKAEAIEFLEDALSAGPRLVK